MSAADKTKVDALTGTNTGDVTVSSPAGWLSRVGQALTFALVAASDTVAGVVSLGAQTWAGIKTFASAVVLSGGVTLNGAVDQTIKISPPSTSGTSYDKPTMWFELTGSNQTRFIQFGSGLGVNAWEFALGYYTGALSPVITIRAGHMFFDLASGYSVSPITPGVANLGVSSNYWKTTYTNTIQLNPGGEARPTAGSAERGKLWYSKSAGGVADTLQICLKSAADTYSWVTIATG